MLFQNNHRPGEDYFVLTPRPLNAAGTEFMTITDDDGLGEWEVVDEPEQVPNHNQLIGFRATYNLEYDDGYDGDQQEWRIIQYSLHLNPHQDHQQNMTMSVITYV
ncbi:hypothetical protein Tco_0147370 [Tanacetum coccineum]